MSNMNRRKFLELNSLAAGGFLAPGLFSNVVSAQPANNDHILVVVELSGGNDGLNSVVPYADDAYYRHRPNISIKEQDLLKLDDHYGFNPGMLGFERLWHTGDLAIIHGCGYENPSYSHFTSMAYWHTAAPNSGNEFGWIGRIADTMTPTTAPNTLIGIGNTQSLAVKSRVHTPVVFDDPDRFQRNGFIQTREALNHIDTRQAETTNATRKFLNDVALGARKSSSSVREAWNNYKTPIDYGIAPLDLPKLAACISNGLPTRLYHVAFRNNAFDTHVQQPALHRRLLSYACDGIHGFVRDVERLGLEDRVTLLVYSEFGRRVPENSNLGTDHGSANVMFMIGNQVNGGHYGEQPSLTELVDGDNLQHTTDFRQVYATAIEDWLELDASKEVLNGEFDTLPIFG